MPSHSLFCDCWKCEVKAYEKQIKKHRTDIEIIEARIIKIKTEQTKKEYRPE